jgi:kinesin family member 15
LGTVINSLIEGIGGSNKKYVPYRDSKLTYILKDSIGGNSKTIMIATISENSNSIFETVSTLKFAERAKKI